MSNEFKFNAIEYASTQAETTENTHWEIGNTPVIIEAAEEGIGNTSGNPHYKLRVAALSGPNQGRRHNIYLVRQHNNLNVMKYARRDLANITIACGLKGFNEISELTGKSISIDIGRRANKEGEVVATFSRFKPIGDQKVSTFDAQASQYGAIKAGAYVTGVKPVDAASVPMPDDIPF